MKALNKQTVLTGALLAVLAVNVSYKTASQSMDLASEVGTSRPLGFVTPPPPPPPVTIAVAPAAAQAAAPVRTQGPRPDVAVTVDRAQQMEIPANICGAEYKIKFVELEIDGVKKVRGYVTQNDAHVLSATKPGTFSAVVENVEVRNVFATFLTNEVSERRCGNVAVDESSPSAPVEEAADTAARQADRIARGLRNCTLDRSGRALRGDARYTCNLNRLETIAEQDEADQDDEDRPRRSGRNSVVRQFDTAVDALKNSIKSLLLSRNEDKQDEGKERLDEVITALEDMDDTGSIDSRKIRSAIAEVRALEVGDRFDQHSEQLAETYSRLDEQVAEMRNRVNASTDPYTSMALGQQLRSLESQQEMMKMGLKNDTMYAQYNGLRSQGVVDASDFSDFTAGYQALLAQISGTNTTAGGGSTPIVMNQGAPDGAAAARQALAQNGLRNYGVAMPQMPGMNSQVPVPGQMPQVPGQFPNNQYQIRQ